MSTISPPPPPPPPPSPAKALEAEERRRHEVVVDERKRSYNSMRMEREPTEEEMEAFRIKRKRAEDPMAGFLG